jgi:hypothetical protein
VRKHQDLQVSNFFNVSQFLWKNDFVENLFHVSLLLKRYNLFDTIFLILLPVSILTDDAIVVAVTVYDKTGHTFQPDYEEPIQVVQEFDPQLKFVTFTVHRDPE